MGLLGAARDLIKGLPDVLDHAVNYRPQEAAGQLKMVGGRVRYSRNSSITNYGRWKTKWMASSELGAAWA
jgi:hypothetical protein